MTTAVHALPIRLARPEDAEALSALSRSTFYETFVDGFGIPYPPEDLEGFFAKTFSPEALLAKITNKEARYWVVEDEGALVALCHAGPAGLPHPEARTGEMELRSLYIARSHQGQGLGSRLMDCAMDWMLKETTGALWVGVWSGNLKAQKLYQAYGFEKVGEYDYPVGEWRDREFILRRA